jgi:hypothetical protein
MLRTMQLFTCIFSWLKENTFSSGNTLLSPHHMPGSVSAQETWFLSPGCQRLMEHILLKGAMVCGGHGKPVYHGAEIGQASQRKEISTKRTGACPWLSLPPSLPAQFFEHK